MGLFSKPKSSSDNVILTQIYCKAMNYLISEFGNGVTIALLRDGISPRNIAVKYTTYCFVKSVHGGVMNDLAKVGNEEDAVLGMVLSDRVMLQGDIVSIA